VARAAGPGLSVVGVPKTIDNDLAGTDHCPGYGSAARFVAQITRETALDTQAMRATDPIRLIEVMGRHAGWLPAAAWLARERSHDAPQDKRVPARERSQDDAPHLVYVPERPLSVERIVSDVRQVYAQHGWCVVVLCENQPTPDGRVIGAVGQVLGDHSVNIARMQCSREERGGTALLIIGLDAPLPAGVLETIRRGKHILSVKLVDLSKGL